MAMKRTRALSLKQQLAVAFFVLIMLIGGGVLLAGGYVMRQEVIVRAQQDVVDKLAAARQVFARELATLRLGLTLYTTADMPVSQIRHIFDWDYLRTLSLSAAAAGESDFAKRAAQGQDSGGFRIVSAAEIAQLPPEVRQRIPVEIVQTAKARSGETPALRTALALEYSVPVWDSEQRLIAVAVAGKIINRRFELVDEIRDLIFETILYKGKPVGTVTVFQGDVRIATNVLDAAGSRAVGTRVSAEVYAAVVERQQRWTDRAFVVGNWYLTAYEPIRDLFGGVIGILYVGLLEQPFKDMERRLLLTFILIFAVAALVAALLSLMVVNRLNSPVRAVLRGAAALGEGKWDYRVPEQTSMREMDELAGAFNALAARLDERDTKMRDVNERLSLMNRNYLDLVSFVSHELKGVLSSLVLNIYNLESGLLGALNAAQHTIVKSVSRNLDYLAATVRNFLSLSRIEKDEMQVQRSLIFVNKDLIEEAVAAFNQIVTEKKLALELDVPDTLQANLDVDLMRVALNNLVSNAVKYTLPGGRVRISARLEGTSIVVECYNDSQPISGTDLKKLFQRFSRLRYPGQERIKGTGIGLFITRHIIERHDGAVWVEPRQQGNAFCFRVPGGCEQKG